MKENKKGRQEGRKSINLENGFIKSDTMGKYSLWLVEVISHLARRDLSSIIKFWLISYFI